MTDTAATLAAQLARCFRREIDSLRAQLDAYADEAQLWQRPPGIANSGGNLILHLCGNLRSFIGAQIGGVAWDRNRPEEFEATGIPAAELRSRIEATQAAVQHALETVTAEQLAAPFPTPVGGHTVNTQQFLVHLLAHLGYHLGQLDYHRRLVTGQPATVSALAIGEIAVAPAP